MAYLAYRARSRLRDRARDERPELPEARFEPVPLAPEAPAGPVAMVARMDDARLAAPAVVRVDSNGSPAPTLARTAPVARLGALGPIELPPKRKLSGPVLAALAGILGVAAIALGATALVKTLDPDDDAGVVAGTTTERAPATEQALALLSKPSTQRLTVARSGGRIVLAVGATGRGVLVLDGLGLAPAGRAYQAWVIRPKANVPASAAVFSGTEAIVPLSVAVKPGSVVAITIERAGGVPAPTRKPRLVAEPAT